MKTRLKHPKPHRIDNPFMRFSRMIGFLMDIEIITQAQYHDIHMYCAKDNSKFFWR